MNELFLKGLSRSDQRKKLQEYWKAKWGTTNKLNKLNDEKPDKLHRDWLIKQFIANKIGIQYLNKTQKVIGIDSNETESR